MPGTGTTMRAAAAPSDPAGRGKLMPGTGTTMRGLFAAGAVLAGRLRREGGG